MSSSHHASARHRDIGLGAVRSLVSALTHSARSIETRTGLTNAQLFLLRQIAAAGTLSVNELAERARTSQSTVSNVVGRMVRARLVRRVRAADDGRRVELSLTPKARNRLRSAPVPATTALFDALGMLTPGQARSLATGLTALLGALELTPEDAPMLFEDSLRRRGK